MAGVLIAFGVPAGLALPSVLAYRTIAVWLPSPAAIAAIPGLRTTIARWAREDISAVADFSASSVPSEGLRGPILLALGQSYGGTSGVGPRAVAGVVSSPAMSSSRSLDDGGSVIVRTRVNHHG
jgi:hypothetical protein